MEGEIVMKILFVSSDSLWHGLWAEQLRQVVPGSDIIGVFGVRRAWIELAKNPDIDVIVIDDNIAEGRFRDRLDFVGRARRRGFGKTILACCSNCNIAKWLIMAGCDKHVYKSRLSYEIGEIKARMTAPLTPTKGHRVVSA